MTKLTLQHPVIPSALILGVLGLMGAGITVANSIDNRVLVNTEGLAHEKEIRETAQKETQRKLDDLGEGNKEIQRLLNQLLLK